MAERITAATLAERKAAGVPIVGLTAYDYPTATLVDHAGIDVIVVGDSLGRLILGRSRLEETTMEDMIHHCAAVSRGAQRALVVGDLPFGTYEVSPIGAVTNAIRLVKEGGVGAVKVEGGTEVVGAVNAIAAAHVPVFGHLAPGHAPKGTAGTPEARGEALAAAAAALEAAGASAIVLVGIEPQLATAIRAALVHIPTIGHHSGLDCDGQLLITPAMLGLLPAEAPTPGPYAALGAELLETFGRFRMDVLERRYTDARMSGPDIAHR